MKDKSPSSILNLKHLVISVSQPQGALKNADIGSFGACFKQTTISD
jgi:hypothetical protein